MNGDRNGNGGPFDGLRVPEPPGELRRSVLGRAERITETRPRSDPWTRLWESRPARLAWAASVLALVVGHAVVPSGGPERGRPSPSLARAGSSTGGELAVIVNLPRLSLDARPLAGTEVEPGAARPDPESPPPIERPEESAS